MEKIMPAGGPIKVDNIRASRKDNNKKQTTNIIFDQISMLV